MGLRLRGGAWYLRKSVNGKRMEIPLEVYGGLAARAKAERAADKVRETLRDAHVTTGVMRRMGIEAPPTVVDSDLTFAGWWAEYAKTYAPAKTLRTQARDLGTVQRWLPIFGDRPMTAIKQMHCVAGLNLRRKAKASNPGRKNPEVITEGTVQREMRFLRAVFQRAVENGIIDKNPWQGIKKVADKTRADRVLTVEDEVKLVAAMEATRPDAVGRQVSTHPRYIRFVRFLLETGLRIDELLNDAFTDNDAYITVTGKFGKTRSVPLTTKAREVLNEQWLDTDRPADKAAHPWWQVEQRFREILTTACERAGIPHISPHDLRHSFGSRFLSRGGDIYVLSKILGHASVAVTSKHYAHLTQENISDRMLAIMQP